MPRWRAVSRAARGCRAGPSRTHEAIGVSQRGMVQVGPTCGHDDDSKKYEEIPD
jgi:hypothetical protein